MLSTDEHAIPEQVSFARRPPHTQAEDWVIYHPDITPFAFQLYMRLRGAVMDPSSSAEDWKKAARFTVDQMRRLMPATQRTQRADPYAGKRTVQDALAVLIRTGALRRINSGGPVPVYDFPMTPPRGHTGPDWGGTVARRIRTETEDRKVSSRASQSADSGGCDLPHGVRSTAPHGARGCDLPHGGCDLPHGVEAVTSGDGTLKNPLSKNPLPLQEGPAAEEEEEETPPPAGRPAAGLHPDADKVIRGISWPQRKRPRGHHLHQLREAVSAALGRGWSVDALIEAVCADVDWSRVKFPASVVLSVITRHAEHASSGHTADEDAVLALQEEIEVQRAIVAACGGCDARGRINGSWHGHGRQGLVMELWELENPEQAALNRSLNGKNFRIA